MRALGYASDVATAVARGEVCCSCSEPFVKAHAEVTACHFCFSRMSTEEQATVLKAVHDEATKRFYRNFHKQRKT